MKALRVEIEGVDGSGKTTGLKYLISQLQEKGKKVLETREVGSQLIQTCVKLREIVLSPNANMSGESMELIFSAMRLLNQDFYKKVENEYDFIVSDRGWLSHLAYTDHNVSEDFTQKLYLNLVKNITQMPDVVIYFDVNTRTALSRRIKRNTGMDVIEMKGVEFQEKVRVSFLKYIEQMDTNQNPTNFYIVDANQSIENVQDQLKQIVNLL